MSDDDNEMMEDVGLPRGATPDSEGEGWYSWGDFPRSSFAAATGRLLFKPDGPGRGLVPTFPRTSRARLLLPVTKRCAA